MSDWQRTEREPTPDEQAGMDWWNSLPVIARAYWLRGYQSAAAAWCAYKNARDRE